MVIAVILIVVILLGVQLEISWSLDSEDQGQALPSRWNTDLDPCLLSRELVERLD